MAKVYSDIRVRIALRPCVDKVTGEKGLFHKWINNAINNLPDALVENESGNMIIIPYKLVKFIDNKVMQYFNENPINEE